MLHNESLNESLAEMEQAIQSVLRKVPWYSELGKPNADALIPLPPILNRAVNSHFSPEYQALRTWKTGQQASVEKWQSILIVLREVKAEFNRHCGFCAATRQHKNCFTCLEDCPLKDCHEQRELIEAEKSMSHTIKCVETLICWLTSIELPKETE